MAGHLCSFNPSVDTQQYRKVGPWTQHPRAANFLSLGFNVASWLPGHKCHRHTFIFSVPLKGLLTFPDGSHGIPRNEGLFENNKLLRRAMPATRSGWKNEPNVRGDKNDRGAEAPGGACHLQGRALVTEGLRLRPLQQASPGLSFPSLAHWYFCP